MAVADTVAPPSDRGRVDGWNPRYVAYARAHGMDPKSMTRRDQARFPSGCMVGFMFWIQEKWRRWKLLNGVPVHATVNPKDHEAFDTWLGLETSEARR